MVGSNNCGAGERTGGAITANDEHAAVVQQRRGMTETREFHVSGITPGAGGGIVDLGAVEGAGARFSAAGDEDAAIAQSRRGVVSPGHSHVPGRLPIPAHRVENLGLGYGAAFTAAADLKHPAIIEQGAGVAEARAFHIAGEGPDAGRRII